MRVVDLARACGSVLGRQGNRDFPTFAAGLRGIEIVEATIASAETGKSVRVSSSSSFADAYPMIA